MLLNKMYGRQLSALSLCLTVVVAPLFSARADEPELVPVDSSATMGAQPTSLSQPLEQSPATAIMAGIRPLPADVTAEQRREQLLSALPAGYSPVYLNQLTLLYAARDMKPMWDDRDAVRAFQQQLAEVAIAGFQPQFTALGGTADPACDNRYGAGRGPVGCDDGLSAVCGGDPGQR